jgi:hypothetical protein
LVAFSLDQPCWSVVSVEADEAWIDPNGLLERPVEGALGGRALEAGQPTTRVGAAAGIHVTERKHAVLRDETE